MNESIAKIVIKGTAEKIVVYATGWLFSDNGFMLSAGHSFSEAEAATGQEFLVLFAEAQYQATLLEFKYDQAKALDYAVLLISNSPKFHRFDFIPIGKWDKSFIRKDYILTGYRKNFKHEELTPASGRIEGLVKGTDSGRWVHLELSKAKTLKGMSGGPVIVKHRNEAIALQSSQSPADQQLDNLATVISDIPSDYVSRALDGGYLFKSNANRRVKDLNFGSRGPGLQKRISLIINDHNNPSLNDRFITRKHSQNPQRFREELETMLRAVKGQLSSFIPEIEWGLVNLSVSNVMESAGPTSVLSTIHPNSDLELRIVGDLSQTVVGTDPSVFSQLTAGASHLVGIDIACSEDEEDAFEVSHKPSFDIYFRIRYKTPDFAVRCLMNIVKDISLDISLFYSYYFNSDRITETAQKKQFSRRKVAFAHQYAAELNLYGQAIPELRYISFAFLARLHPDSMSFDTKKYLAIWEEFLLSSPPDAAVDNTPETKPDSPADTEALLEAKRPDRMYDGVALDTSELPVTRAELISRILALKKIGHQISKRSLTQKVNQLHPGELYIFAFLARRPNKAVYRDTVRILYKRNKYKGNDFDFFSSKYVPVLRSCKHLFHLYLVKIK